ncbi:hypothetical protein FKM82_026819 [Ascaphus truei]
MVFPINPIFALFGPLSFVLWLCATSHLISKLMNHPDFGAESINSEAADHTSIGRKCPFKSMLLFSQLATLGFIDAVLKRASSFWLHLFSVILEKGGFITG